MVSISVPQGFGSGTPRPKHSITGALLGAALQEAQKSLGSAIPDALSRFFKSLKGVTGLSKTILWKMWE